MTIKGALAFLNKEKTFFTTAGSPAGRGGRDMARAVGDGKAKSEGTCPCMMSAGRSTKAGPGRPYQHFLEGMQDTRSAHHQANAWSSRYVAIRAGGVTARLLIAERNELDPKVDGFFSDLDDRDTD
ncbi:hypothetical protein KEM55_009012 [Ascosphaera atra]|nr:hypothetical protein KEM55_009012 [Ascosphaera atra]